MAENNSGKDSKHRLLELILRFGTILNSSLNIEDVLNFAMQWAEDFIEAEASTVYELDEQKDELFIRVARGEKQKSIKKIKLHPHQGIAGHVVKTGEAMIVQDVTKERLFDPRYDEITGFKTRCMICVPLKVRSRVLGALQVLNKKGTKKFTYDDVRLLTNMSQQIAVAMENANLYRRLEEKFEFTALELKDTQEKLIRTERLAAMGNLVQGVAHEIRNPVTTIGGFALRIKKDEDNDKKVRQYADIILKASQRLENVVGQIGQFVNLLSSNASQKTDIKELVTDTLKDFISRAEKLGISVKTRFADGLPPIVIDYLQIKTAISNILGNAVESMPEGGSLIIGLEQQANKFLVTIEDTGHGIPKEDLNSVYDPFFTSKTRGAGLGLTMVYQVVMNHKGEIDIQSRIGKGTKVTIRLPLNPLETPKH